MNEARKKRQAEIAKITKPWTYSTGPRTPEGKARVAQNATKHGLRGGILRKTATLLAQNSKLMKEIEK